MKNGKILIAGLALGLITPVLAGPPGPEQARILESRKVVKQFMGRLKGELQQAMRAGGPVRAIEVCRVKAPAIAGEMSQQTGWRVGRTSLKVRNPNNAPDAWERRVLEAFEARKARGEDVRKLEHAEIVAVNGKKQFRYMKAIPTGKICLKCHGAKLDPAVAQTLAQFYPQDKARGFRVGDIRGAFTITQPLD